MKPALEKGRLLIVLVGAGLLAALGFLAKAEWEERWMPSGPPEVAGRLLMERKRCLRCHLISGDGGETGPDLTTVALRKTEAWLDIYLRDPRELVPDGKMPRPKLTDPQHASVLAYLMTLNGSARPALPAPLHPSQ
jgi:cbb3-type cytochrome oxidase cytochrome c subunit